MKKISKLIIKNNLLKLLMKWLKMKKKLKEILLLILNNLILEQVKIYSKKVIKMLKVNGFQLKNWLMN